MEEIEISKVHTVFRDQPISCPWITTQPYPSTEAIKNKLNEFVKNHGQALNNTSKISSTDAQSSSTHFFYFLRLMQLFPDTHPATLHTVLTLSKNNFFYAIDKLLYAKKYKSNYTRKQTYPYKNTRGRGGYTRGRAAFNRNHQLYQPASRSISDDLAEVQRIIGLAEKPYIDVQTMASDENSHVANGPQNINTAHQVVNICMENTDQGVAGGQTFIDNETQEVIEIVCFENDQQIEEQKVDDHMELESFTDNAIENSYLKNQEPPVIVVDGINELNVDGEVKKGCSDLRQLDMELEMNNPKAIDN